VTISAEDLSTLTPDEQEAVLAAQQPETDVAPEGETVSETVVEDQVVEDPSPDVEPVAEGDDATEVDPLPSEFVPQFDASTPEGIEDQLAALDEQESSLDAKFEDGELDTRGLSKAMREISSKRTELLIEQKQADWAKKQNDSQREQRWKWEQEHFFGNKKNAATYNDPVMVAALDSQVKILANDPENANRPASWFLEEADSLVRARFSVPAAPTLKAVDTPARKVPPTVRTIGDIPAAAPNPTGDDRAEKIGMLEGEELERYVSRMSADDRKKLSRAA